MEILGIAENYEHLQLIMWPQLQSQCGCRDHIKLDIACRHNYIVGFKTLKSHLSGPLIIKHIKSSEWTSNVDIKMVDTIDNIKHKNQQDPI